MSSIFSVDNVKNSLNNKNKYTIIDDNEYLSEFYFFKSMKYANESYSSLLNELNSMDLSHGIVDNIYSQKIKLFNPVECMNVIVERFENNCNNLMEDFKNYLYSIYNKDFTKSKDYIDKFNKSIYYPYERYIFKNLSSNTTYINNISKLLSTNFSRLSDFIKMLKDVREEDVIRNLESIIIDKDVNRMNSVRGFLLGKDRIEEQEYGNELFKFFRIEKMDANSTIDSDRIKSAYANYIDNNSIDVISREITKFTDLIKNIVSGLDSFSIGDRIKTEEGILLYNNIITEYCKELEEICNIFLLYIGAKLDAYKEFCSTNSIIITIILSKRRK